MPAASWRARRLVTLIVYGEGPHLTALCLLPLAIGLLHVALTKRRPWYYVLAALAIAAVPLSNWLGAMALAFSHRGVPAGGLPHALALGVGSHGGAGHLRIRAGVAVDVAGDHRGDPRQCSARGQQFRIEHGAAHLPGGGGGGISAGGVGHGAQQGGAGHALCAAGVVPVRRYGARPLLVPALAGAAAGTLPPGNGHGVLGGAGVPGVAAGVARIPRRAAWGVGIAAALACVPIVVHQRRAAREMGKPIDIRTTIEYKTAKWLDAHMPGQRVFAPGTIGFWLNAFSDVPQLTGGFDNGIVNPMLPHVIYQVYAGDKQQVGIDLLKAYGCDAVIGGGKESAEVYHPVRAPGEVRRADGIVARAAATSSTMCRGGRGAWRTPCGSSDQVQLTPVAYDTTAIQPYLAALDNPSYPAAAFHWRAPGDAVIAADLKPEHILSVQITWDKGWKAYAGGQRVHAWGDKLGQMVVEPRCSGPCTVELKYDGGTEGIYARAIHRAGAGRRRAVDTGGDFMAKAFGFDEDELKMLLVAVRQMRRTFAAARKTAPEPQPAVDAYARLYDDLYEKLLDMAGPLPPTLEDVFEK